MTLQVLNLFVALLLDSFQDFGEDDKNENQDTKKTYLTKLLRKLKTRNKEEIVINRNKIEKGFDPYDISTTAVEELPTANSSMHPGPGNCAKVVGDSSLISSYSASFSLLPRVEDTKGN